MKYIMFFDYWNWCTWRYGVFCALRPSFIKYKWEIWSTAWDSGYLTFEPDSEG
jgi:hypothetical protein